MLGEIIKNTSSSVFVPRLRREMEQKMYRETISVAHFHVLDTIPTHRITRTDEKQS